MDADNGGVDHLNSGIMGSGKRVYDAAPDASPPPTEDAIVACGIRTKHLRKITPWRSGAQDPEDAIEDTTVVHPRNATRLVRQHRLDGNPFKIGEFIAHNSSPQFGSLNHRGLARRNASGEAPVGRLRVEADISQPTIFAETVENDPELTWLTRLAPTRLPHNGRAIRARGPASTGLTMFVCGGLIWIRWRGSNPPCRVKRYGL